MQQQLKPVVAHAEKVRREYLAALEDKEKDKAGGGDAAKKKEAEEEEEKKKKKAEPMPVFRDGQWVLEAPDDDDGAQGSSDEGSDTKKDKDKDKDDAKPEQTEEKPKPPRDVSVAAVQRRHAARRKTDKVFLDALVKAASDRNLLRVLVFARACALLGTDATSFSSPLMAAVLGCLRLILRAEQASVSSSGGKQGEFDAPAPPTPPPKRQKTNPRHLVLCTSGEAVTFKI